LRVTEAVRQLAWFDSTSRGSRGEAALKSHGRPDAQGLARAQREQ
jgi:hypothetical protein